MTYELTCDACRRIRCESPAACRAELLAMCNRMTERTETDRAERERDEWRVAS
jgi:hypothetical protein